MTSQCAYIAIPILRLTLMCVKNTPGHLSAQGLAGSNALGRGEGTLRGGIHAAFALGRRSRYLRTMAGSALSFPPVSLWI